MKGKLFVLEGIDGAGTEVQSKLLLEYLKSKDRPAVRLVYPDYETPIGKLIHDFLHKKYEFGTETQFLLHAADRIKDKEKINQLLDRGVIVICDRYFTSTLAYQCLGQGFPLERALKFADTFEMPKPDRVVYLKISPETSMKRKRGEKGDNLDRNESDKGFLENIARAYDELVERQIWASWFPLDGERSKKEVFEQVKKVLGV